MCVVRCARLKISALVVYQIIRPRVRLGTAPVSRHESMLFAFFLSFLIAIQNSHRYADDPCNIPELSFLHSLCVAQLGSALAGKGRLSCSPSPSSGERSSSFLLGTGAHVALDEPGPRRAHGAPEAKVKAKGSERDLPRPRGRRPRRVTPLTPVLSFRL